MTTCDQTEGPAPVKSQTGMMEAIERLYIVAKPLSDPAHVAAMPERAGFPANSEIDIEGFRLLIVAFARLWPGFMAKLEAASNPVQKLEINDGQ